MGVWLWIWSILIINRAWLVDPNPYSIIKWLRIGVRLDNFRFEFYLGFIESHAYPPFMSSHLEFMLLFIFAHWFVMPVSRKLLCSSCSGTLQSLHSSPLCEWSISGLLLCWASWIKDSQKSQIARSSQSVLGSSMGNLSLVWLSHIWTVFLCLLPALWSILSPMAKQAVFRLCMLEGLSIGF